MNVLDLRGKVRRFNPMKYSIDWTPEREVSGPQAQVKAFLRPYWQHELVLEEAPLVGSRMRIDLWNVPRQIIIEVSPASSHSYSPFFHGTLAAFSASLKRDLDKVEWARLNGLTYVEVDDEALANLSTDWFKEQGVIL